MGFNSGFKGLIYLHCMMMHGLTNVKHKEPVSASSKSAFRCLPRRLRLFCLHKSTIFVILLLFCVVKCRSQFDLHLLSFSPNRYTFNCYKISSFFVAKKGRNPQFFWKNIIYIDVKRFSSLIPRVRISFPYKKLGSANALYTINKQYRRQFVLSAVIPNLRLPYGLLKN
jgi:hypothetical protein